MADILTTAPQLPVWTIGDRLAKARDFAGLNQQHMADQLRISRRSIVRHESSAAPPRSIVLAYASVTKVPVEWLEGKYPDSMFDTATYRTPIAA